MSAELRGKKGPESLSLLLDSPPVEPGLKVRFSPWQDREVADRIHRFCAILGKRRAHAKTADGLSPLAPARAAADVEIPLVRPLPAGLGGKNGQASLSLLIDSPELLKVRMRPAQFARLLGVSKQAVSRWIAEGKVTLNPVDGLLDAQAAVQQVLRNTDPGRLRSRILRAAVGDVQQLRESAALAEERVAAVAAELRAAQQATEYEAKLADRMACTLDRVLELLVESELALRATTDSDEWRALIMRIDIEATATCDGASIDTMEESAAEIIAGLDADRDRERDVDGDAGPAHGGSGLGASTPESEARDE
jgi:predicted transcriptional regulator